MTGQGSDRYGASVHWTDDHGLTLSTSTEHAAAAYRDGVALLLSAWPGAALHLDRSIALDPDFALAHAARARLHAIHGESAAAGAAIEQTSRLVAIAGSEREKSHVDVLWQLIRGRPPEALDRAIAHIDRWPRDVLIFSLPLGAFGLLAFSGRADHDQARVDLVERHADRFDADDWWFGTYRGWAHAENGNVAHGRAMIEHALDLRPANANGAHALAHAMFEGGAGDEADRLLSGWLGSYDRAGVLHGHLVWHRALAALEKGDAQGALALYADHVAPGVTQGLPINVVSDAASLLWRIEAYGHGGQDPFWADIAAYAAPRFAKAGHAFIDVHMAMIEAATGDDDALRARLARLAELGADGAFPAGPAVEAIGRAMHAFRGGDHEGTIRHLEPVMNDVPRMGGSRAQREIAEDILLIAFIRAGRAHQAHALLARRLARRPSPRDQLWAAELSQVAPL